MDQETYDRIPETLDLRELRYAVVEKGRRTKVITVVTTLTVATVYNHEEIAELYGYSWPESLLPVRWMKRTPNLPKRLLRPFGSWRKATSGPQVGTISCSIPSREKYAERLGFATVRS